MPTRSYRNALRKQAESETIKRIIEATVQLHAEKGALGTSHADIAHRAGVSIPTVYKHFPNRNTLIPACSGMVAAAAPGIEMDAILSAPSLTGKLSHLVEAVYTRYEYFHPWSRWTAADAAALPELAKVAEYGRTRVEGLVRDFIDKAVEREMPPEVTAMALVVLDYPSWNRLTTLLKQSELVNQAAVHALQLLISSSQESE
ncbi:TetR/AcrR family transcriptional regulator [Noviherbaspirillum saxi]|uniref:TetR/AcrR family transcriptional regulator n=1 Tax=Noviherbaspirillum saxi TaxID=2320863 RepID=A0A3A3G301_9BURK|nr:TetR/AcrR family transcriptional regulator [Noviherbaspirillum saxi]RJF92443.1 TetR/AcrR family transcriptional regulator [Noviherbaspirillum saxi]